MKKRTHFNSSSRSNSGVALVIVLSMIVLLSALMVTFMSRVSNEGRAAKTALQGFEARQAAETAVNLVISQIRAATYDSAKKDRAWASQPGAIRTFKGGGDEYTYKLYSSDTLVEKGSYKPSAKEAGFTEAGNFTELPEGYVNLNEPIFIPVKAGNNVYYEAHFPICDPRAKNVTGGDSYTPGGGNVKGFHSADVAQSATDPKKDIKNEVIPILPMNVKWLYQLRDGQLVAAKSGDGEKLKIEGASKTNPPIARIAFWTDDESAKLNLNTASEHTYWDTPSVTSEQESGNTTNTGKMLYTNPSLALSAAQPAGSEYQRFPGHPATTSLSPALRWMFPSTVLKAKATEREKLFKGMLFKEAIYRLAPRINGGIGSSMGSTQNAISGNVDNRVFETDRLLSTVDDYFFRPDRSPLEQNGWYNVFQNTASSKPEVPGEDTAPSIDFANPDFTPERLEQIRFFLTTTSRSPELNIYGLPRMSIWPVNYENVDKDGKATPPRRSGYDKLIAFCSTVAGSPTDPTAGEKFYFQRENPWSATHDMTLTDSGRNTKLYNYMLDILKKKHPAGTASFVDKYQDTGMRQILTSMFDYIRCTNLIDTHNGTPRTNEYPLAYTPAYGVDTNLRGVTPPRGHPGAGQVVPLKIGNTKGFGRFPTVSEVAVIFYFDDILTATDPGGTNGQLLPGDEIYDGTKTAEVPIRCALAVEMFTPSPGFPMLSEAYAMTVTEDVPFKLVKKDSSGQPVEIGLNIAPSANPFVNYVDVNPWRAYDGRFFMATRGFWNQMMYETSAAATAPSNKEIRKYSGADLNIAYKSYPFISKRFVLTDEQQFKIKPGKFTIKLHPLLHSPTALKKVDFNKRVAADLSAQNVIQTFEVDFSGAGTEPWTLPVPVDGRGFLQGRAGPNDATNPFAGDVVRSMEISGKSKGDYRFTAAMPVVSSEYFARAASSKAAFSDSGTKQVHNFRSSWGRKLAGAQGGKLVAGESPRTDKVAKVAVALSTGIQRGTLGRSGGLGDFDRGISKNIDGAFINKPDEGNTRFDFSDDFTGGGAMPYYRGGGGYEEVGESFFTPNRMVASAAMFGSLPTGVSADRPWETLLFSPGPQPANPYPHKGAESPRDHYLLDFFHMPVVEPYAISEPLSTAGKVNINCKLAPFGYVADSQYKDHDYIERYTGIHGLLTGMYQLIVNNGVGECAHGEQPLTNARTSKLSFRLRIDPAATVEKSFAPLMTKKGGYFKTASEICEVDLLTEEQPNRRPNQPDGYTDPTKRDQFWERENALTGDNQRERPYSHIYPRATTKSNVFTVHVRTQSLAKSPTTDPTVWDESKDSVTGEYRGATTIERFIDPNDQAFQSEFKDIATKQNSLEPLYRFRIVNTKTFTVRE